ncbi:MAG TPA: hypothetical protein VGG27_12565 [Magnetospirillaceae bacterium]|jgi:hypothetical protein
MRTTVILGAGPGGTGPLTWAAQNGLLRDWIDRGVTMVDRRKAIGGTLGRYMINSDSLGGAYLECLDAPAGQDFFAPLRDDPTTRAIAQQRSGFPALELVDRYLHRLGGLLEGALDESAGGAFRRETEIRRLHLQKDGSVVAEIGSVAGGTSYVEARTAIMALGGRQNVPASFDAGSGFSIRVADLDAEKIVTSDIILTAAGMAQVRQRLAAAGHCRIVILGGAHSAYSAAWALTTFLPDLPFEPNDITIVARRAPRIFYDSRASADADRYPVEDGDICPRTLRVNRLAGLRGNGRDIWRRMEGCDGVEAEPRARTILLTPDNRTIGHNELARLLDEAALIVTAFGYRSRTIPVFGPNGRRLQLRADRGGAMVDQNGRVCLADGTALPQVFGIGLGTGYVPFGTMGGEPNFRGQANSWWLYQNGIGKAVYQGIHDCLVRKPGKSMALDYGNLASASPASS